MQDSEAPRRLGFNPKCVMSGSTIQTCATTSSSKPMVLEHAPFKAPAPHEPVIPSRTTLAISVIGSDALGRVIADQCQRPMRVAALAGCSPYERLEPERAARVLRHERGGAKGVPPNARHVVMVTKVPTPDDDPLTAHLVDEFMASLIPHIEVIAIERTAHGYRSSPW